MTALRVRVAAPADYPALVDLVLREQPHLETAEVAPVFLDDRLVAASDDVPVGWLLRPSAGPVHRHPRGRMASTSLLSCTSPVGTKPRPR
jgi:hypothetical protein